MTDRRRDVTLITGASSGLGAVMAREFASRGHDLALCARRMDRLETLKAEIEGEWGVTVRIRPLDVNDYALVEETFEAFARDFGRLDRVVVNAGVGEGGRIGMGHFKTNLQTANTNFIAALAQCEAAVAIFRRQNLGHLVVISSMSAMRGLPRGLTTYAASKAAVAHLAEGIRLELLDTPIRVSTIYPGYIRTELNASAKSMPFEVDEKTGGRAVAHAILEAPYRAYVPWWPWSLVGWVLRRLPVAILHKVV